MKLKSYILMVAVAGISLVTTTSCQDMLTTDSSSRLYADKNHLVSSSDTVNSVVGILTKLQKIAVRTNLLGEVRADLVKVQNGATLDLKALANFDMSQIDPQGDEENNRYNKPADYYSVINNCNYFLANADTTVSKTGTVGGGKVFAAEYAAVKFMRAWTYLQLALNYGENIPLITEPILTQGQADEAMRPEKRRNLQQIVTYFLTEDNLQNYVSQTLPDWGSLEVTINAKNCFFPGELVLADLYLWDAVLNKDKTSALNAAQYYYKYLQNDFNGKKKSSTTNTHAALGITSNAGDSYEVSAPNRTTLASSFIGSSSIYGDEYITGIGMDSASADGSFNQLRQLYNSYELNGVHEAVITPSDALFDIVTSQQYCGYYTNNGKTFYSDQIDYTDQQKLQNLNTDLRFYTLFRSSQDKNTNNNELYTNQTITKHTGRDINIYRRTDVWLKLAEALNYAGYPRFSRAILVYGLDDNVIANEVIPYYPKADSAMLASFSFDVFAYKTAVSYDARGNRSLSPTFEGVNNIGIHTRGSGLTHYNQKYIPELPLDSTGVEPSYPYELVMDKPVKPSPVMRPDAILEETVYKNLYAYYVYFRGNVYDETGKVVDSDHLKATETTLQLAQAPYAALLDDYDATRDYYNDKSLTKRNKDAIDSAWKLYNDPAGKTQDSWYYKYNQYLKYQEDSTFYEAEMIKYNHFIDVENDWRLAANAANRDLEIVQIDSLILNEQALESCFEGRRYYELMRNSFWHGSGWSAPSLDIMHDAIEKRDPAAAAFVGERRENLFLRWKGQIGPGTAADDSRNSFFE